MIHREPRDGQEGAQQRDASVQNGGASLYGQQNLTPEERQRVIYDFNETATSLPEVTLAGMFERQAAVAEGRPARYAGTWPVTNSTGFKREPACRRRASARRSAPR